MSHVQVGPDYSAIERGNHDAGKATTAGYIARHTTSNPDSSRLLADNTDEDIANYNYPSSTKNTCRCFPNKCRLIGRINVLEADIPPGENHPKYPGLRTRIICVVPSGWPLLFLTCGLIVGVPVAMLNAIDTEVAVYGAPFVCLSMAVATICLGCTTFKDPGIFPRYTQPQDENWAFCQKTNSYRPPGVVFDNESDTLIEKIDHFCPWSGTTIAGNNYRQFQFFVVTVFLHAGVVVVVAVVGLAFKNIGTHNVGNLTTLSP